MLHPLFARFPARLRFDVLPDGTEGVPAVVPVVPTVPVIPVIPVVPPIVPVDLGFPPDTAVKDMTDPQKIAYWTHHSRKHEAEETRLRTLAAANADKASQFDALALANASDADKAVLAARAAGVVEGSTAYLKDAVTARLLLATGKSEEDLAGALDLIDVTKLTTDGVLDVTKVAALAVSIGVAVPAAPGVPPINAVAAALAAQHVTTAPVTGSSIAEMQKAIIAEAAARKAALTPTP